MSDRARPPKSIQGFVSLSVWTTFYESAPEFLFLLPAGRPRFLAVDSETADFADTIHAGGRPRRFAPPRARRSRLTIASSICTRSCRNSSKILFTSTVCPPIGPQPNLSFVLIAEKNTDSSLLSHTHETIFKRARLTFVLFSERFTRFRYQYRLVDLSMKARGCVWTITIAWR
jgi:hypothetical protein